MFQNQKRKDLIVNPRDLILKRMISRVLGPTTSRTNLQCSTASRCLREGRARFPRGLTEWAPLFPNIPQQMRTICHHVSFRRKTSVIPVPACSSCQALEEASNLKLPHQTITMPPSLTASRETTSVPEPSFCPKPREECSPSLEKDLHQGIMISTNPL